MRSCTISDMLYGLQEKVGQGHYNPTTTRVLHLVHNPASEAQKAQERARAAELTSENAALKAQLAGLKAAQDQDPSQAGEPVQKDKALAVAEAELTVSQHRVSPTHSVQAAVSCRAAVQWHVQQPA